MKKPLASADVAYPELSSESPLKNKDVKLTPENGGKSKCIGYRYTIAHRSH